MLADTLYILGYRPEDDSWDVEGRRTYIHDDDASRAWLISLARVLRSFAHANGELIELEIGGPDTSGHFLHHLSEGFQPDEPHQKAGGLLMSIERQGHLGMGSHQSAQMLKDEWLTPPEIIKALGGPESFDLDPCAPIKRPWDMAKEHYTIADNGLLKPWHGRVWFNPPYGGPPIVGPWMRRMADHGVGTTLIFARTETELFFETVWKRATALLFLQGRLYFHHVDGKRAAANAGAPSVLIAYGERDAGILRDCGIPGQFVPLSAPQSVTSHNSGEMLPNGDAAVCGADTALSPADGKTP